MYRRARATHCTRGHVEKWKHNCRWCFTACFLFAPSVVVLAYATTCVWFYDPRRNDTWCVFVSCFYCCCCYFFRLYPAVRAYTCMHTDIMTYKVHSSRKCTVYNLTLWWKWLVCISGRRLDMFQRRRLACVPRMRNHLETTRPRRSRTVVVLVFIICLHLTINNI